MYSYTPMCNVQKYESKKLKHRLNSLILEIIIIIIMEDVDGLTTKYYNCTLSEQCSPYFCPEK